jgi:hypothetical protein
VRVLVFTLLFVLGLFAYSQEILNVNFGTIPTGFGGNADTVLTINVISSQRSQDVGISLIVCEVSLEMTLL